MNENTNADDETLGDTWEPRPLPKINPETREFWESAKDGEFLLRECSQCNLVFYYPRTFCPDCFSYSEWKETSGKGSIYSFTVMEKLTNWPDQYLPLIIAFVELEEGPRVITNIINCDPNEVYIGMDVEAEFIPSSTLNIAIPVFSSSDK